MGTKWEVNGYAVDGNLGAYDYYWDCLYMGNSSIKALWVFFRNKKKYGCVKLELRA